MKPNSHVGVLVVDMLKDFFKESKMLPSVRKQGILEKNVATLIAKAHQQHLPVIYVNDNWKNPSEMTIDTEFKIWGPHAIDGTEGAEVLDKIAPTKIDFVVSKHRYSGFFNTNLDTILRELAVTTVVVSGVHTNCCVQHTVMDAFFRGFNTVLVSDCSYSPTEKMHLEGIEYMRTYYGTRILTLREALEFLANPMSSVNAT